EAAYRSGLAVDPNALDCYIGLATVAISRNDATQALAAYDAVLARQPRWAPAHVGRAWALGQLGRKDDARRALDVAEQLGGEARAIAAQRQLLAAAVRTDGNGRTGTGP